MFWFILLSLILAAFVLSVLDKTNKYPSQKHKKLAAKLLVEESQSEVDYQKQIRKEKVGKVIIYIIICSCILYYFPFLLDVCDFCENCSRNSPISAYYNSK